MKRLRAYAYPLSLMVALLVFGSVLVAAEDGKSGDGDDDALVDSCKVNLCIAVDQGGSTTEEDYKTEMKNVIRLVSNLKKSDGDQFLSVIGYSDSANPLSGSSLEEALSATSTLAKSDELATSGTNVGDAIMKCTENMNTIPFEHRNELNKVIMVLTDDNPSMPISRDVATAYSVLASYAAAAENATVMTVGVGSKVNSTLLQLSSTAGSNGSPLTFKTDDWDFATEDFQEALLQGACRKGEDGQVLKGQADKPGDLTTLMISVLNGYNDAQDKTEVLLSYPEVVDNIKQVAKRASSTNTTSDMTYLDVVYRQDDKPSADWLKSSSNSDSDSSSSDEDEPQARMCKEKPTCRIYLENMVCCSDQGNDQGIVSGSGGSASLFVMCSETIVGLPPKCLQIDGPSNADVRFNYGQKLKNSPGVTLHFGATWDEDGYVGDVVVDANATREMIGNCQLQLTDPCEYNDVLYKSISDIQPIVFSVINGGAKRMASLLPDDADMSVLTDSIVWMDESGDNCMAELNSELPDNFFGSSWVDFQDGFTLQCNSMDQNSQQQQQQQQQDNNQNPQSTAGRRR